MRGRPFGTACVVAVAIVAASLASGCGAAPDPQQKPTPEQQSAPGSGAVLSPDMTSVTGNHRLTFSGSNPTPNNFALMNATGSTTTA